MKWLVSLLCGPHHYPFRISQAIRTLSLSLTVNEIRQNVGVDADLFEPPK
jgi:hypothetical protein